MFTGIVEGVGRLVEIARDGGTARIRIESELATTLAEGASLAVNGVCLTAVALEGRHILADVGPETARVTTLGSLQTRARVNLERPMRADGRLDGHFVLGHVDGMGTVVAVRHEEDSHWLTVEFPDALTPYFIRKGSVAVDGVSLTIAELAEGTFNIQVIPYTWMHTTLGDRRPGDAVNLECDMIGKYVVRALEARRP
jgi:riboflavin synthase